MDQTLQAGDELSHYRVVGPLGAGGMGEIYLAQDLTLERAVALKVLPGRLVKNEERLRRFVLEAKAASALNHPNIVTIHEIGSGEITREGETPGPIHFIAMERIDGHTLHDLIHHEREDLRRLLGYLAQAAEGIAKAHAAGIVHRDLKPGNIMVSRDGFAKVLDFGLAKLTEARAAADNASLAPTRSAEQTTEGTLVGTVGYMSPEQVQGKAVDFRADIFSFGCILYEAITRKRAFEADSTVDTMHKILHDAPAETAELNPAAPADLRRLVRRCLAKSPDQRLQSMKDLAIELREIVDDFDALSRAASSGGTGSSGGAPSSGSSVAAMGAAPRAASRGPWLIGGGVALLVVAGVAFTLLRSGGQRGAAGPAAEPVAGLKVTTVSGRPGVSGVGISGDGRYLAYPALASDQTSIWVRQVATGSEVQVVPPRKDFLGSPRFSPSGDYLFFLAQDPDHAALASLERVPTLGGPATRIASDVGYGFNLTRDGKSVSFIRMNRKTGKGTLILHDLEQGQEKTLATVSEPLTFAGAPALSPDGRTFVTAIHTAEKGIHGQCTAIDATSLAQTRFGATGWESGWFEWLPDGKAFLQSAFKFGDVEQGQVFLVSYPDGRYRRVTNDTNEYTEMSVTADGQTIAALRTTRVANVWSAAVAPSVRPRQLTFNASSANAVRSFVLAGDSTVVFGAATDHNTHLWTLDAEGQAPRQITPGSRVEEVVRALPDGRLIVSRYGADNTAHLFLLGRDGGDARPLVSSVGEWFQGLSPDGQTLVYARVDSLRALFSVPVAGGPSRLVASDFDYMIDVSPEGRRVAYFRPPELEGAVTPCAVVPIEGGAALATFTLPPQSFGLRWAPDGQGLSFIVMKDGVSNIYLQPLAGGPPRPLTRFTAGTVGDHRWTPDGRRLVLSRTEGVVDNLWIAPVDGAAPAPITDFATGSIFRLELSRDGQRVYFLYGSQSKDIVLLKDFR